MPTYVADITECVAAAKVQLASGDSEWKLPTELVAMALLIFFL